MQSGYDYSAIIEREKRIAQVEKEIHEMFMNGAKIIAARFLELVIPRTPKGDTGKLHQTWKTRVIKSGNEYLIIIFNPMEYALFVENGHRQQVGRYVPKLKKRLKNPWVEGAFMMKTTVEEIEKELPELTEKIQKRLEGLIDGI